MVLRILLLIAALGAFVVGNIVLGIMSNWTRDLPSTSDLKAYEPPVMTRIYAGDGQLVKEYAFQHRVFVPEEEIPDHLIQAFISAEDKTFFEHSGIDLKGMVRGTVGNAVRGRRIAGGSTITQQVVKNMLVGDARSVERKIREAFVAVRLEDVFEKRDILELYMNEIYLGGRSYGVGSAALNYFGKSLKELDLGEAALLAAMPKAPGSVNPYKRPERAKSRRNWVLSRMHANGYISEEDMTTAQELPLTTVERLNSAEIKASGYFVEEVRREILRRSEAGEIEGIAAEEPRIRAKFEAGSLDMRDLYPNKEKMVEFLRELSTRSLVRVEELEEIMRGRVECTEDETRAGECGQKLFASLTGLEKPQDIIEIDMVMNWRERLRNYRLLYEDGLSVRSTLDSRYQLAAQRALQIGLETYDRRAGFRGPVTSIELGEGWPDRLEKVRRLAAQPEWSPAVVLSANSAAVSVGLPDGSKVDLDAESVNWTQAGGGLSSGDVVYVTHEPAPNALTRTVLETVEVSTNDPWHVRQVPLAQGALIAMDPHTGRILAMAGGYSFQTNQFNRAVQAQRQPGSSFKPIVYAAALDAGYTPASIVLDAPFVIPTPLGLWKPANYSAGRSYGNSTLRLGIEKSRNLMTARLAQDVGMDMIAEYGRKFGIYPTPSDDATEAQQRAVLGPQTYLSRSLGAGETTPLKMAMAYSIMVNGGKQIEPILLDRIQNRQGQTILRRDSRACEACDAPWNDQPPPLPVDERKQVLDPITAYQSVSMMEGVVSRGTASRVRAVGKHVAGKTGTTNDYVDAWFVGFSPDLVAAVWVGKDTARSLEEKSLGEGESGGRVAAPIFRDFMMVALADKPDLEFRRPSGVRLVEIDAKTGKLPGPYTGKVIEEAFRPGTEPGAQIDASTQDEITRDLERLIRGDTDSSEEIDGAAIYGDSSRTDLPYSAPSLDPFGNAETNQPVTGEQGVEVDPEDPNALEIPPEPVFTPPPPDQTLDMDQF